MILDNIKLGFDPEDGKIYLYRHGEDPQIPIRKREADEDVFAVLVSCMEHGSPEGSERVVRFGDDVFLVKLEKLSSKA